MFNKKKNNKGFTLVELLVVIAIIGILAVVAVPSLMKNINKANAADVVSYASAVRTQALTLYADNDYKVTAPETLVEKINADIDDRPANTTLTSVTINDAGEIAITITAKNTTIAEYARKQLTPDEETTSSTTITILP